MAFVQVRGRLNSRCSVLLNLYRYSDATRNEFIRVLGSIKKRLWLSHRAAHEYFENRLTVIAQQEKAYEHAVKTIQALQDDLSNARQHPFISDKLMRRLSGVLGEVVDELGSAKAVHENRASSDEIRESIGDIFAGKVGVPYTDKQLDAICEDGESRYARKIPPGYKDGGKEEDTSSGTSRHRKYGDLVIWRQIIDLASEAKRGVIFINDDKKEDWWLIARGKMLGPRPELISEFRQATSQAFYMYQADRFLEYAAKHLKQVVTSESMDEIRDLRKRDLARRAEMLRRREDAMRLRQEEAMLRASVHEAAKRLQSLHARMAYLEEKERQFQHGRAVCQERLDRSHGEDHESLEKLLEFKAKADSAQRELMRVHEELATIEREHAVALERLEGLERMAEQLREPGGA
ncbi:MAG TPA: PIN-like domain-containing protein [Thermoguttaceae bacterium]|nr:PIN-like domain-containing protein [Thermoguttaceae bacterium]